MNGATQASLLLESTENTQDSCCEKTPGNRTEATRSAGRLHTLPGRAKARVALKQILSSWNGQKTHRPPTVRKDKGTTTEVVKTARRFLGVPGMAEPRLAIHVFLFT